MYRFCFSGLLLLFACPQLLPAQQLVNAGSLNLPDSGMITAGALDATGNLYLASTLQLKTLPGQAGLAGLFPAGDPVLSKFGPDGALLWRREFPGNMARICDAAVTPDQGLIITGGYLDSFRLAPGWHIPGVNEYDAGFFIARLDADGNIVWIDTRVSTLPEDCIGWTLAVADDAIYVAGMQDAIGASLRRYDFDGTLRAEKIIDIRSVSDLTLDEEGRLYAVGTASPGALFANLPVPAPPQFTGYANYVARLDSGLTAQWIRSFNYATFDEHPKVAAFKEHVFALSNDFDLGPNLPGCYRLKAFSPDGDLVWADSILGGAIPPDYQHFALQPFCDHLLLQYPSAAGMAVKAYDAGLKGSLLLQSSPGDFEGSFPFMCTNEDVAVFGSNFRNETLGIGGDFVLHNDKSPVPRQFILQFGCAGEPTGSSAAPPAASEWRLAPNPAASDVSLYLSGGDVPQNTRVELLDATGRLQWSGNGADIPVAGLPAGAFLVRVTADGKTTTLRGIKL